MHICEFHSNGTMGRNRPSTAIPLHTFQLIMHTEKKAFSQLTVRGCEYYAGYAGHDADPQLIRGSLHSFEFVTEADRIYVCGGVLKISIKSKLFSKSL